MKFDKKTVQILLLQYDKDHDNEISFQEFYELFTAINEQYIDFLDIDLDSSGCIDSNELEKALRNKGFHMSAKFFSDLFMEILKRANATEITFDLFVRITSRFIHIRNEFKNSGITDMEKYFRKNFFIDF